MLIDSEIHKMIHELEHSVNGQGLDLAGYLKSINKTHDDLHTDFRAQAIERIKACLLYTSDAADERSSVDLGGRRIIKKKKKAEQQGSSRIQNTHQKTDMNIRSTATYGDTDITHSELKHNLQ